MDLRDLIRFSLYYFLTHLQFTKGAHRSCYDHIIDKTLFGVTSQDGVYNVTINGVATPVYCDMTTGGGGWTLLVAKVEGLGWNMQNILERNERTPGLSVDYSILGKADYIKANAQGNRFQFALEATGRGRWGARFSAPTTYSLVNYNSNQTDIQVLTKYDSWDFLDAYSIGKNLPWIDVGHDCALLTTRKKVGHWYGTLVMKQCYEWSRYGPSPWLISHDVSLERAKPVYYWLRENDPEKYEVATLLPTSEAYGTCTIACDHVIRLVDKDLQTGFDLPAHGVPGCTASFVISTALSNQSNTNFLVRVFGSNLYQENLIVTLVDKQAQHRGLFKKCHLIKSVTGLDQLDFVCDMPTPSVLHLFVFAKNGGMTVTEIGAIRM